jgi:hypothetical protein
VFIDAKALSTGSIWPGPSIVLVQEILKDRLLPSSDPSLGSDGRAMLSARCRGWRFRKLVKTAHTRWIALIQLSDLALMRLRKILT